MIFNPRKAIQIYLIFLTSVLLTACGRSKKIDVSNIDVKVKIERFDHDLDAMRTKPMLAQSTYMIKKYGIFYQDYMERIMQAGTVRDTAYFKTLRDVFSGQSYADLKHDVDSIYPNLDKQEEEIAEAFKYIKYYYPKKKLPKVFAYFSGFQAQTSIGDGYFAIGLDMFLGANSKFYPALTETVPHYISRRFTPDNITPRVVEGIAREDMYPENPQDKSLLSRMIYSGKIMYFMDRILPDVPDSTKIGYTGKQIKWCDDFKSQIWGYFLEENLLYESDYEKIQKYLGEAPFTPGLAVKDDIVDKQIGNLKTDEQVAYSTITLNFYQNDTVLKETMANADPSAYNIPVIQQVRLAFTNGWIIFMDIVVAMINLWVFVLAGVMIWMGYKFYRKRSRGNQPTVSIKS